MISKRALSGVAAAAVGAGVVLTGLVGVEIGAFASTDPAPSCAAAMAAYQQAQTAEQAADATLADAQKADDQAKDVAAKAKKAYDKAIAVQHEAKSDYDVAFAAWTPPKGTDKTEANFNATTDGGKLKAALDKANADLTAARNAYFDALSAEHGAYDALVKAQGADHNAHAKTVDAQAVADQACKGQDGTPGAPGAPGPAGAPGQVVVEQTPAPVVEQAPVPQVQQQNGTGVPVTH